MTSVPLEENLQKESLLLIMTIQIDKERTGKLEIYENDQPQEIAKTFCEHHKLNKKVIPLLINQIQINIEKAKTEKANMIQYLETKKQQFNESKLQNMNSTNKNINLIQEQYQKVKSQFQFNTSPNQNELTQNKSKMIQQNELNTDNKHIICQSTNESQLKQKTNLYQRSQTKKKELEQKFMEEQIKQLLLEQQECTYHPKISQQSSSQKRCIPIEQHLLNTKKQKDEKLEEAIKSKVQNELNQCSFHPQIDKISQTIVKDQFNLSNLPLPRYQSLFLNSSYSKIKVYEKNYSFHPQINDISQALVKGTTFEQRQCQYKNRRQTNPDIINDSVINQKISQSLHCFTPNNENQNNIQDEQEFSNKSKHFLTQQTTFRPQTGRSPETRPKNLHLALYQQAKQLSDKKAYHISQSVENQKQQTIVKAIHQSDLISQSTQINRITELFNLLDSNEDGLINYEKNDKSKLNSKILKILEPFFLQMETEKQQITLEQFIQYIQQLLKILSNTEKHNLLMKIPIENNNKQKIKC